MKRLRFISLTTFSKLILAAGMLVLVGCSSAESDESSDSASSSSGRDGVSANGLSIEKARLKDNGRKLEVEGETPDEEQQVFLRVLDQNGNSIFEDSQSSDDEKEYEFEERPAPSPACVAEVSLGNTTLTLDIEGRPDVCDEAPQPPQNNPPICTIDTPLGNPTITVGGSVNFTATVSDADVGDTISISWVFNGGTPSTSSQEDPGSVTYNTPGTFTATLDATDNNNAACAQQTRTITVNDVVQPNNPPVANPDNYSTNEDTALNVAAPGVLANDTDADGDGLSVVASDATSAQGASVNVNANGGFVYNPTVSATLQALDTGESTADTFGYTISDGNGGTDAATVTVTVFGVDEQPVNNAPVCVINQPAGDPTTITVGGTVNYSGTVTDADGDAVTIDWNFEGGSPSNSDLQNPGLVTYNNVGNFLTTLDATDGQDVCTMQTRTIIVQDVVPPPPAPDVSINSTSLNTADVGVVPNEVGPVAEQPFLGNTTHRVLAINDLGMHCGDLDTRVASILPPFQALLAQVVQRGSTGANRPQVLDITQAEVVYSAVSNPNDPILSDPNAFTGVAPDGSVYKTNFWDVIPLGAYDPFYPPVVTPLSNAVGPDTGLPVPNVEHLYIGDDGVVNSGDEQLLAVQHAMPGLSNPYLLNEPHVAEEHYTNKPFFVNFPFGYVAEGVNWFEGAGIPYAAFDDFGRENAYPLVRVQANVNGTTVATTDTVLPISGEASCKNCHSSDVEVTPETPNAGSALVNLPADQIAGQIDDPAVGELPVNVSIEYATDVNILRLHDLKHGSGRLDANGDPAPLYTPDLEDQQPIVCQRCHYTPALDLAHVGPLGPENDPVNANGRDQLRQSTMSNVMHSHHGSTGLFPPIPAAIQAADGTITNQGTPGNPEPGTRLHALEQNCYQCHPGKNVQCLRGAMFNAGMLCSDCHGDMQQVGNDFSANVSPDNVGAFQLTGNFYDPNDPQPRVPWANEPGCGSCHTGDATNNLAGSTGTVVNVADIDGNSDGIRLRQAFRNGDAKATPIVPANNRFAENIVSDTFNGFANPGAGNPKLYRVSTGHGGVMCEGCHGPTHAEWPNANPNANDNVAAEQIQGHSGTIGECNACHTNFTGNNLNGPHGMHPVGNTQFANGNGHPDVMNNNGNNCRTCHGQNGEGTVLSRTFADRNLPEVGFVPKGTPITCTMCHGNEL